MSADSEGPASSYRESVVLMMEEIKKESQESQDQDDLVGTFLNHLSQLDEMSKDQNGLLSTDKKAEEIKPEKEESIAKVEIKETEIDCSTKESSNAVTVKVGKECDEIVDATKLHKVSNENKKVEPTDKKVEQTDKKVEQTDKKVEPTDIKVKPTDKKVSKGQNEDSENKSDEPKIDQISVKRTEAKDQQDDNKDQKTVPVKNNKFDENSVDQTLVDENSIDETSFDEIEKPDKTVDISSDVPDSTTDPLELDDSLPSTSSSKKTDTKNTDTKNIDPDVVELSDDEASVEDPESESDDEVGNPDRPPGEDSSREIDPDHLLPFHHGWKREVIVRKGNEEIATQYDVSYLPPENGQYRTREAKRKRSSKCDQEKYFIDFPSSILSIKNFSYVRRPLGMNNAAYEILRKGKPLSAPPSKPLKPNSRASTTSSANPSSAKSRRVSSYKEVEESTGLLVEDSENDETDDEVVCINGFDVIASISLQVNHLVLGLRAEHKKRHKKRDPQTCCTPPLAEDSLWSGLEDDPMGIYNELGGRSSPTTPPPLRAVHLTPIETAEKIKKRLAEVRSLAEKREFLHEQDMEENLASHDFSIRKFKNFKETRMPSGYISSYGQIQRQSQNSRYSSSLIMKPVLNHMKNLPGISWSKSSVQNLRTCSMQCPGTNGSMPDLQCISCQRLYHAKCQGGSKPGRFKCRLCQAGGNAAAGVNLARANKESIKMKLPMQPVNGKRPIVELVMLQNGKYQPIKFSNNVQVTETIPKSLFLQANSLRKTVYQKATQVPRVGSNSIYIAVNPSSKVPSQPQTQPQLSPAENNEQVSILVKAKKGGKPVLLNVPRKIALKVKNGTTLSFSASSDQKYVVISNKIHPPIGKQNSASPPKQPTSSPAAKRPPSATLSISQQQRPQPVQGLSISQSNRGFPGKFPFSGILPPSVSLEPVPRNSPGSAAKRRPGVSVGVNRTPGPQAKARRVEGPSKVLSSGEIVESPSLNMMTPCTPYCPGVTGFPELECSGCKSLFHSKCVGIPASAPMSIKNAFKCKMCARRIGGNMSVQVIDLD